MADEGRLAQASVNGGSEHAASNGGAPRVAAGVEFDDLADRVGQATGHAVRLAQDVAGEIAGRIGRSLRRRLTADLDDRDPDYIRENLSLSWLVASLWYRAEVRNLGNIPERGRVLLVGNHTGGNLSPETIIFTLAFSTYFGVERRYHQLAHNLVLASPLGPFLRRFGTVAASHSNARKALEAEAAVLVFPGGDWEVHRPSWQSAKIDFGGRKGFVRLALEQDAPIVPVVTIGGQETALWLDRGAWLASLLRLDRTMRLKVLPILVAPPWGLTIGDFLPRIPLPAKMTTEVLPAIDLKERFGPDPDPDEVYEYVTTRMQSALDGLAAERRFPVIG
jgi:1-acyl-sn-glycerol-3-phosphate acyltransferase